MPNYSMNPKAKFIQSQSPINWGAYKDTTVKPKLPGLGGAPFPASPSATSPVKTSPAKAEYVNNLAQSPAPVQNTPPVSQQVQPAVDPTQKYRSAFDEYIRSLAPTSEETTAQNRLNALTTQNRLDYEKALESGETLGYATGLAGQQARTAAIQEAGAAGTLSALSGRRQAMTEAQKARTDFERGLMDYELKQKETPSISEQYGTGAIGEYNFARSQGYQGSFTDYQNEDANRKARSGSDPITQAIREQTLLNLQNKPPTERQAKAAAFANRMSEAERILSGNANFDPTSVSYAIQRRLPEVARSSGAKTQLNAEKLFLQGVLRLDTGATITPQEVDEYAPTYFPRENDPPELVAQKKRNRDIAVQTTIGEAGRGYEEIVLPPIGNAAPQSGVTSSGIGYTIIQE